MCFSVQTERVIQGSFLNKILGFVEDGSVREGGGMTEDGQGCYARLEIRKGNQTEGEVLSTLDIDGTKETDKAFAKDTKWRFAAKGVQLPANEEEGDGSRPDGQRRSGLLDRDYLR